jgi:enoyl-CoA hydratase/carnithine racemase
MPSQLLTERIDATLLLTVSDPASRNRLSPQACAAGIEALGIADADPQLHGVVLRGDGRHFVNGPDCEGLADLLDALRTFPKPVIAAVEGGATGAGCSLALGCDLVVAADDAHFEAGEAEATRLRSLPHALALQLLWLPEDAASPAQLQPLGLVNRVCRSGQALSEALQLAKRLQAVPAERLARSKEQLRLTVHR